MFGLPRRRSVVSRDAGLELLEALDGWEHEYDWQFHAFCDEHDDRKRANASLSVTFKRDRDGLVAPFFKCRQCGKALAAVARRLGIDPFHLLYGFDWAEELASSYGTVPENEPRPLPAWNVPYYESSLSDDKLERLCRWRGLARHVVRAHHVGLRGDRYALPAYSHDLMGGGLVGLMLCRLGGTVHLASGSSASLYPDIRGDDWVLIVEGPWDSLLGRQYGLPTITGTAGAGTWSDEWGLELSQHRAFVLYDCDNAGRGGAAKVRASMPHATVLDLAPRRDDGYDLSDHLRYYGNADRIMELIKGSK